MDKLTVDKGDRIFALDDNIRERRANGYGVTEGVGGECSITRGSGDLGTGNTLNLASGEVQHAGTPISVASQSVGLQTVGDTPRWDVIYINSNGNPIVVEGQPEAKAPADGAIRELKAPTPDPLQKTQAVVLAAVYIEAGAISISSSSIVDKRVSPILASSGGYPAASKNGSVIVSGANEFNFQASGATTVNVGADGSGGADIAVSSTDTDTRTDVVGPSTTVEDPQVLNVTASGASSVSVANPSPGQATLTVSSTDTTRTDSEIRNAVAGQLDVATLVSGSAANGQVPTADGTGGVSWADQSGGTSSGGPPPTTTVTANYTPSAYENVVADASAGAITITLPSPSNTLEVTVKKLGADVADGGNAVTVATPGTEQIFEKSAAQSTYDIVEDGEAATMICDGTDYYTT